MKRFIPDSIGARTVIVLVLGLTLSHILSLAIYYGDRVTALTLLGGGHNAERIVTITRLVERTPSVSRAQIIDAVNDPTLRLISSAEPLYDRRQLRGWRTQLFYDVLREHLGGIDEGRIVVNYVETAVRLQPSRVEQSFGTPGGAVNVVPLHGQGALGNAPVGPAFQVSIQLPDSTWLNYETRVAEPQPFLSLRIVLSTALMAATVILLAVWAMRRVTAPLGTFAQAAGRLGVDVNAPPLSEAGPREVRQVTQAFNEMQQRIRRLLGDRTQMVAAISHDLRTPITRLRLRAEFIADEEQRTKMLRDLEDMEMMISSVLSFAKEDAAHEARQRIDLAALLQSICDDMADAELPVEFEGKTRLPYDGRPMALKRALTNLIDNAVKYGKRARVELVEGLDNITVQIDDDGPGIPESEQEKVFAPFYRIDRSRSRDTGGAGLGLAFTRTIIRAHGGDIKLVNRAGGGLRVIVTLPR